MSKAFTKETDDSVEADLDEPLEQANSLPEGVKNYITPGGAEKLRSEWKKLLNVERPKLVETVAWAASNGDRSENADYIYGKRRLREIDRRLRFLTKRLEAAEIIDPTQQKSDQVLFGATVKVKDSRGAERVYRIVGIDEIDAKRGHISWVSPVGRALLRSRVGDSVTLQTPRGEEELEILELTYETIS